MTFSLRFVAIFCFAVLLTPYSLLNASLPEGSLSESGTFYRDSITDTDLNEIVITATRTPKALKDVPVVTRVINEEEIKKSDATNIQDLLTLEIPGLEFGYSMTQETSLVFNGFGGNSLLFLVDGERIAGETLDNIDYSRLNLQNIKQVEIIKGGASALYGANAIGGVINLISNERTEPWHVNLNSRYSYFANEWRSGAQISFNRGKWNSNTTLQYIKSDYVQLTDPLDVYSPIHQLYGGSNVNIKERLTFSPSDNLRFILRGGYFFRESDRITYKDHFNDYDAGIRSVWQISDKSDLELSYSFDQYDKSRFVNGIHTDNHDYSNRQHTVHALFNRYWGLNCLTVGADYMYDYLASYQFKDNETHAQSVANAFVQFDYSPLNWLNIVASVRNDYYSAIKHNALTERLAVMIKTDPLTLRASYSGGYRAPSLKELYMDFDMAGIMTIYGNPDLKAEKSQNFNVAVERNANVNSSFFEGSYSVSASGFFNYYNTRITLDDIPDQLDQNDGLHYVNEKNVKILGVDINARYKLKTGIDAFVSINWLHNKGRKIDSQFVQPRPFSATSKIGYDKRFNKNYEFYISLSGRYLSKPQSQHATGHPYSLWKIIFQQNIWKGLALNLAVDNIFNYKPKTFYWNSPLTVGTSFTIGLSVDIDKLIRN